ncbi:hypothetical protein N7G274_001281 [Stereocaulon virgatum]|uniref:Rhodopsin domain-containing protein n=1 Tax=Stereocaulon virgatum TaxID=373712 RepID=A0ABR4AND8_9LECA
MGVTLPPGVPLSQIPSAAPPPGLKPNFVNPVTLAGAMVAVSATTLALAIVLVSLRLYSTLRITRSASYDDGACVVALMFAASYVGLVISIKDNARHAWDLPLSALTDRYGEILFCEQIILALGNLFAKLSILLLLLRLFSPTKTFRYMVYFGIMWTTVIPLTSIIVASALCAPRKHESFGSFSLLDRCAQTKTWAVVQGVLNVCLDFYILYLPVPLVWKLQMEIRRKLGVMAIFMTGFIACLASILGLIYKVKLFEDSDILWNAERVMILNLLERNVTIMVACMPACASFSRFILGKVEIVSMIRSRLSYSGHRKRKTRFSQSRASTLVSNQESQSEDEQVIGKNYWKTKNVLSKGKDDLPPQITMNQHRSHVLQSGDFRVFDVGKDFGEETRAKGGAIELQESLGEKTSAMAPYDMV